MQATHHTACCDDVKRCKQAHVHAGHRTHTHTRKHHTARQRTCAFCTALSALAFLARSLISLQARHGMGGGDQ